MATLDDLNAAVQSAVDAIGQLVAKAQADATAAPAAPDYQSEVDSLNAATQQITDFLNPPAE